MEDVVLYCENHTKMECQDFPSKENETIKTIKVGITRRI